MPLRLALPEMLWLGARKISVTDIKPNSRVAPDRTVVAIARSGVGQASELRFYNA